VELNNGSSLYKYKIRYQKQLTVFKNNMSEYSVRATCNIMLNFLGQHKQQRMKKKKKTKNLQLKRL